MASLTNKLTSLMVKQTSKPGRYADGNCLYLYIDPQGSKRWVLRIVVFGRRRDMGLGSVSCVGLEEAREKARSFRKMAREGLDPIAERNVQRSADITFKAAALSVHALNSPTWKSKKHAEQWLSSLELHVFPIIGEKAVSELTSNDVLLVLSPLWVNKNDTAKKLRQRLRMVVKWARAKGYFSGEDPVELAEQALPRVKTNNSHFKAVNFVELPQIIQRLHNSKISSSTKLALEFLIITACRTTEVLGANWSEIQYGNRTWLIPAERMKAGRAHEVPITVRMLDILKEAEALSQKNSLIFPSQINGRALSNNTLRIALQKRLNVDATVHGMRSSFKDWVSETTTYANEVSEMALGHSIPSKVEAAYRRGNLLEKRRQLMEDWSNFLLGNASTIINIKDRRLAIDRS